MPGLSFSTDVFIGTNDGTIGINFDNTNGIISYKGGLVNYGGYKYPVVVPTTNGTYSLTNNDSVVLLNTQAGRGVTLTVALPSSPMNGKIFYLRRIDASANSTTVVASGTDVIRLGSTSSVTSFNLNMDTAYTLAYGSGVWWLIRNGGSAYQTPAGPAPIP